jgi:hypothetical protein
MMKEITISPERIRAMREEALAERPAVEAGLRRADKAAEEPTYSGWLRRQIHSHPEVSFPLLQEAAGINKIEMIDFLEGLGTLTTSQADAICGALGVVPAGAEKVA